MEFKNLRRNILDILGERFVQQGDTGPYSEDIVYDHFADFPRDSVKDALEDLRRAGYLSAGDVRSLIRLTERGLNQITVSKKTS